MTDGQTPKRATFNLTESSGGLDNIKNASFIPKVTQDYEISRKHKIKTTDSLKLLKRWSNSKNSDKHIFL